MPLRGALWRKLNHIDDKGQLIRPSFRLEERKLRNVRNTIENSLSPGISVGEELKGPNNGLSPAKEDLKEIPRLRAPKKLSIGAVYHGGHSSFSIEYPPFDMMHRGTISVTDKEMVFEYSSHSLMIPLDKVDLNKLDSDIEDEEQRSKFTNNFDITLSFDDNGKTQRPQFNIPQYHDVILLRDWLDEKLGRAPKKRSQRVETQYTEETKYPEEPKLTQRTRKTVKKSQPVQDDDDMLHMLKVRLAKGEITLDEYKKIKKELE